MNKLFDSRGIIKELTIALLCKNNEKYLKETVNTFNEIENYYKLKIQYIFIENDSTDKTVEIIKNFLTNKIGHIHHPNIELNNLPRTIKMAALRNMLKTIDNLNYWTLILDTDIYFEINILEKLFEINIISDEYGMICSNGLEAIKYNGFRKYKYKFWKFNKLIKIRDKKLLTQHHYYDTYAYRDINNNFLWPHCNYFLCRKCNITKKYHYENDPEIVTSAFGGMSLVKTELIKNQNIRWEGIDKSGIEQCEHIEFCKSINKYTKNKVAIARNAICYWEIP